jgi:hypothetical protein
MKPANHKFLLKTHSGSQTCRSGYSRYCPGKVTLLPLFSLMICFITYAQIPDNKANTKGATGPDLTVLYDFDLATDGQYDVNVTNIELIDPYVFINFYDGGTMGYGSIIKMKTDGTGFTRWWTWNTQISDIEAAGSFLYGAKRLRGSNDNGTIFKTGIDGTDWKTIFDFPAAFSYPYYDIEVKDTIIYGTANESIQPFSYLFSIKTDGTEFRNLFDTYGLYPTVYFVFDNHIFGTLWDNDILKIFRLSTDGAEFMLMDCFNTPGYGIGPYSLILVDDYIYGLAGGGQYGYGKLWRVKTDGTDFSEIYSFASKDGVAGKIILQESYIYGVSMEGGAAGVGRIFRFKKDGTGYQKIFDFNVADNGYYPGDFVMSGDTIFGRTYMGGAHDVGTVYKFNIGEIPGPVNNLIKVKKLSIKTPEEIELDTKGELNIEKGHYLDLDTTFTASGNVAYTFDWKVKSGGGYEIVNHIVQVNNDRTYYIFLTTIQGCSYIDSLVVQAKAATGMSETELFNNIKIYPNPNRGNFYLKLPEGCKRCLYKIYDSSGVNISSGEIDCQTNDCLCNIVLDDFKPGTYTLAITRGNVILSKYKFIIIGN